MHMEHPRGFTLIELLVVIAIIGLLSAVVLASLNAARAKGADAAVRAGLSGARTQAELFYSMNGSGSYSAVCSTAAVNGVKSIYDMVLGAAKSAGHSSFTRSGDGDLLPAVCNDTSGSWAAQVQLREGTYFCVDSTGKAMDSTTSRITTTSDRAC